MTCAPVYIYYIYVCVHVYIYIIIYICIYPDICVYVMLNQFNTEDMPRKAAQDAKWRVLHSGKLCMLARSYLSTCTRHAHARKRVSACSSSPTAAYETSADKSQRHSRTI